MYQRLLEQLGECPKENLAQEILNPTLPSPILQPKVKPRSFLFLLQDLAHPIQQVHFTVQGSYYMKQFCNKGRSHFKKTVKKGDIVPFWRPPPLNGSKGDIFCLITDKSA